MSQRRKRIYLAGGLFNAGQRLHNLMLARHLRALDNEVILPQQEALKFRREDGSFDLAGIVEDCRRTCADCRFIVVANADGADADSGTSIEYGIAVAVTGRAVVYRTDFRTAQEQELGLNAMFTIPRTKFVYHPCFAAEEEEIVQYYTELAAKIDAAAHEIDDYWK